MRIDAHVHYTPPSLARELSSLVEQEPYWGLLLSSGTGGSLQDWVEPEQMLADMDRAGIDRAVIQGGYWQRHESCQARNTEVIELIHRYPDRLSAFAVVQPRAGDRALDELARCLDAGMCGVGELGPYGQDFSLDDPDFLRLVEACLRYEVPLNLHVSEEVGHFYTGKSTTPLLNYYRLAGMYPELRLILAHWGGGLIFYETMPEVRRTLQNVWYDTAASPLLYPTEAIFRSALSCVDFHKILYASDYPLRICPRKQRCADFLPFLAEIDALGLEPEIYTAIMGDNAARLLGLGPDGASPDAVASVAPAGRRPATGSRLTLPEKPVDGLAAVRAVVEAWPATRAVFEQYRIPWQPGAVPFWEPVCQAAAARGLGPQAQARLLADLNAAISSP